MRPLRYSINVTLDGCCDHRAGVPGEELQRHATETLRQADALLFGRVTYQMMEAAFRPAWTGEMPASVEPFRHTSARPRNTSCRARWSGSIGRRSFYLAIWATPCNS